MVEEVIIAPQKADILLGRGKHSQTHPGNLRLYLLLEAYFDEYESKSRKLKFVVAEEVLHKIKTEYGSRFLTKGKQDGVTTWEEVHDDVAIKKISHDFRTLRASKAKGIGDAPSANSNPTANASGAGASSNIKRQWGDSS